MPRGLLIYSYADIIFGVKVYKMPMYESVENIKQVGNANNYPGSLFIASCCLRIVEGIWDIGFTTTDGIV